VQSNRSGTTLEKPTVIISEEKINKISHDRSDLPSGHRTEKKKSGTARRADESTSSSTQKTKLVIMQTNWARESVITGRKNLKNSSYVKRKRPSEGNWWRKSLIIGYSP